jgi:hypothetical protein
LDDGLRISYLVIQKTRFIQEIIFSFSFDKSQMTLTEEDKDDEYNPDCQKLLLSETIRGKFLYSKIQRFICQKNLIERKSEKKKI